MRSRLTAVLASALFCVLVLGAPAEATFPGQNGKIVFFHAGNPATINPDGTGLTELPRVGDLPAWSPDGSRIAFAPCFAPSDGLCTTNAEGGDLRRIPGTRDPSWPSWAPTGDRLVIDDQACTPTICSLHAVVTVGLDGASRTVLDFDGGIPDWSPDGSRIAFYRYYPFGPSDYGDLFVINADGTGLTQLTGAEQPYESIPSWSPDGTKIAYMGVTAGEPFDELHVFVINADGTGRRQLTDNAVGSEGSPVWSPDGRKIAYVDIQGINIMNADGTGQTFLTPGRTPDWQTIPGPKRHDYKNAAAFCKAERDFLGEAEFRARYGGGASAHGKCVSGM
jgi:Tol biopolymer transport system component